MNKLPIPVSSFATTAPALRPAVYAHRSEGEARVELLENRTRLASGRFALRRPPESALERPEQATGGFDGPRGASPQGTYSLPYGASAGFLAQLIGQSIQTGAATGPATASGAADSGNTIYRRASEVLNVTSSAGGQFNIAV